MPLATQIWVMPGQVLARALCKSVKAFAQEVPDVFQLARDPATITLHDVYLAIGSPALLHTGARETGRGCPVQQVVNDALDDSYRQAQALLEQRLRGTTLATLGEAFARHLAHHAAGVPHDI